MVEKNNNIYFIIKDEELLIVNNLEFLKNIKDCFYIKKFGSRMHPKIYLDIKKDNEWIKNNEYIGDYYSLVNFIIENNNEYICLNGFDRVSVSRIVKAIDNLNVTNTKLVKKRNK